MFNNEEEIRSKLIQPYIIDLGFDLSEILLEDSFSIRLGRTEKPMRGRSDFLCKRNGQNLFLIEIKNDSHEIIQDDIDQAISYSRALIDNIAPFTLITNGKTTKLFDTITKAELNGSKISEQSNFWKNGCRMSMDDELRIRYEALLSFVSFSKENLNFFCREQINDRVKLISGDIHTSRAKFISSLHQKRKDLRISFKKFLNSDSSVFGIVGNAGVGKTCSMCSLALDSIENNFSLFYNGTLLSEPIIDTISKDLNLFFSAKSERDKVLNKLDEIGRYTNKIVIIFIDAIDENISNYFPNELSEFAYSVGKLKNIKICISCKSTVWNTFLNRNETNNHTYHELIKFHPIVEEIKNPGFLLREFDKEESEIVISAYRDAFNFKGNISAPLLEKLNNGFFLRIFSEVYKNKVVPTEINDIGLIEKYLEHSLGRTSINLQTSLRILGQIGKTILKNNLSKHRMNEDEGIDINLILDELNLPPGEDIPQELFDRNILIKTGDKISYKVSFYYSTIRDYIICFHSYRLNKIHDEVFYNCLTDFFENYIGQSAISFYLKHAKRSQLDAYIKFKKDKSLGYVNLYNSFLDEHFSKFKQEFDPKTRGRIGIIIPNDLISKDGYALFPLKDSTEDLIQYDGFDQLLSTPWHEVRIFNRGAKSISGSNSDLMVKNQEQVVKRILFGQLKKIVENGLLDEYDSDILLLERVSSILYYNYKKLDYQFKIEDYYIPRFDQLYPLDLIKLSDRLYKFRAEHYYRRKKIQSNLISKFVEEASNLKKEIPRLNVSGDFPPYEELFKVVNILIERGYSQIENHYLPCPDISLNEVRDKFHSKRGSKINEMRAAQFSNKQAEKYLKLFFSWMEDAYKQIVESNFPTFLDRFEFYNNIPHEYIFYTHNLSNVRFGWYGYKKSPDGKFNLFFRVPENKDDIFKNDDGIKVFRGFDFDKFININNPIKTVKNINSSKVDENCVIRNWTYQVLIGDLNNIVKRLVLA